MARARLLWALTLVASTAAAQNWQLMNTPVAPAARESAAMVFDASKQRMLLYGGGDMVTAFDDTWEWDGQRWAQVADAGPGRLDFSLAYDSARSRAVLFGGSLGGVTQDDTWEWDGASWQMVSDGGAPGRIYHSAVYSPDLGLTLVFGGTVGGAAGQNVELWGWNGSVWRLINNAGPGGPGLRRRLTSLVDDPVHHRVLLFGGVDPFSGPYYFDDTWQFDGAGWTQLADGGPSPRSTFAMGTHPDTGDAVLFGGATGLTTRASDTWSFDGTNWRILPVTGPSARRTRSAAVDPVRRVLVVFGGFNGTLQLGDTWELPLGGGGRDGGVPDGGGVFLDGGPQLDGGSQFDGGPQFDGGSPDGGPPLNQNYPVACACDAGAAGAAGLWLALLVAIRRRR